MKEKRSTGEEETPIEQRDTDQSERHQSSKERQIPIEQRGIYRSRRDKYRARYTDREEIAIQIKNK